MNILVETGLYHYLFLSLVLFCLSLWGIIICKNIIKTLICTFTMFCSIGINFTAFAVYTEPNSLQGLSFSLFIILFALINAILFTVIIVSLYKYKKNNDIEEINEIKG